MTTRPKAFPAKVECILVLRAIYREAATLNLNLPFHKHFLGAYWAVSVSFGV